MNHLIQEANSFSKINWTCAVTLNPFVGFGKFVFGRKLQTGIFEKSYWLINNFRLMCAWWDKAENGMGGNEIHFFFLFNGTKLVKMHFDGKLIYLAINIY